MIEPRLASHMRVTALRRMVESSGGFAMVLKKGDATAGAILLLSQEAGGNSSLWEWVPKADGEWHWLIVKSQTSENKEEFQDYLDRRTARDRDLWLVELSVGDNAQFAALLNDFR